MLNALTFENGLTAIDHGDGTYTLRDVPIFGEVAADSNGNKIAATPEWLRSAFDRAQLSQSEGFAGPVHEGGLRKTLTETLRGSGIMRDN